MEGELEAMNLGRGKPSLADEIDALAADDMLSEELEVLKQSMEVERMRKTSVQFVALFLSSVALPRTQMLSVNSVLMILTV